MHEHDCITAIVLAGDRGADDPVAIATGTPCKALAPVAGRTLVERVTAALAEAPSVGDIHLVGPARAILDADPDRWALIESTGATWIEPADSPAASATRALRSIPEDRRVLVTSVDHGLLHPDWVDAIHAGTDNFDFGIALVPRQRITAAYPQARPTTIRLGSGYCTANLFMVGSAHGRRLIDRWRAFEAERKHPARYMARLLGWHGALRYLLGLLSLESARERLEDRLGQRIAITEIDDPEAAFDVDTPADLTLAEDILARRDPDNPARLDNPQ